jgi:hypothetical protein
VSKKSYEHKAIEGQSPAEVVEQSAELGRHGWEMISVVYDQQAQKFVAFLKRKVRHGKSHE